MKNHIKIVVGIIFILSACGGKIPPLLTPTIQSVTEEAIAGASIFIAADSAISAPVKIEITAALNTALNAVQAGQNGWVAAVQTAIESFAWPTEAVKYMNVIEDALTAAYGNGLL